MKTGLSFVLRSLLAVTLLGAMATNSALAGRSADAPRVERTASPATAKAQVEVLWNGIWWDATVVDERGSSLKIHYIGWESSWDEWVSPQRYRAPHHERLEGGTAGQNVEIQWRGGWWPGRILETRGSRYRITYDGYGPQWDEWITTERLRAQSRPNV